MMCFINPQPFTKAIFVICKGISEELKLNTHGLDTKHYPKQYKIGAMDIACAGACRGGFPGVSGNPFWISLLQLSASQIVYQLYLTKTISIIGKNLTIQ